VRILVGILNLLLGLFDTVYPAITVFIVIPKLLALYSQSNIDYHSAVTTSYILNGLVFILGLSQLYFAYQLLILKQKKFIKPAVISLVIIFLFGGYLISSSTILLLNSVYKLTTSN
jgi:uncharacterized membrane protein